MKTSPKTKLVAVLSHLGLTALHKGKFTAWICPCCKKANITHRPSSKAQCSGKGYWDSMTECLFCGNLSFVCVWPGGKTKVL